jgi:hypothetical protein
MSRIRRHEAHREVARSPDRRAHSASERVVNPHAERWRVADPRSAGSRVLRRRPGSAWRRPASIRLQRGWPGPLAGGSAQAEAIRAVLLVALSFFAIDLVLPAIIALARGSTLN